MVTASIGDDVTMSSWANHLKNVFNQLWAVRAL
jgi:hypothetical protein